MMHFKIAGRMVAGGLALALSAGVAAATTTAKIGAQAPGGSFYTYAATFAKLVDDTPSAHLKLQIVPRGGAFGNPTAVNRGIEAFGFTTTNAAAWARAGLPSVYKGHKEKNLRIVTSGMQSAYTIVLARKSYVESHHIKTVADLLHGSSLPRIGMKPTGSQVPIIADMLFKSEGTSLDALRKKGAITQASSGQITSMVSDGRLDVYIENAPAGQATLTEMTMTNDMVFVPFTKKEISALGKEGLPLGVLPANSFRGQTKPYDSPVSATVLVTNKSVPSSTVYAFLKTLVANRAEIAKEHPPLKAWDPAKGCHLDASLPPLHPGAIKLCKELGYLK